MSLHPELEKLLPTVNDLDPNRRGLSDTELTAFALAVARTERERCAKEVANEDIFGQAAKWIRTAPDPDWATPPCPPATP